MILFYIYIYIYVCVCELINLRHFLFNIIMATVPIALQITTSTDEDNRTNSDTDLSKVNTKDECILTSVLGPLLRERNYNT